MKPLDYLETGTVERLGLVAQHCYLYKLNEHWSLVLRKDHPSSLWYGAILYDGVTQYNYDGHASLEHTISSMRNIAKQMGAFKSVEGSDKTVQPFQPRMR